VYHRSWNGKCFLQRPAKYSLPIDVRISFTIAEIATSLSSSFVKERLVYHPMREFQKSSGGDHVFEPPGRCIIRFSEMNRFSTSVVARSSQSAMGRYDLPIEAMGNPSGYDSQADYDLSPQ
jgi:hypothetical protein